MYLTLKITTILKNIIHYITSSVTISSKKNNTAEFEEEKYPLDYIV